MSLILAVDDELDMLDLIRNILKKNKHQVDVYQNPLDVDNSKLSKYDLILIDVMMPGIDGISFCKEIRNKVDCPILFLTAKTMEEDIVEGLLIGGDDYITKPFGAVRITSKKKRTSIFKRPNIRAYLWIWWYRRCICNIRTCKKY